MSGHLSSAINGRYEPRGHVGDADCIQVHSFGTGAVNLELANIALGYADDRLEIMADQNAEKALLEIGATGIARVASDIGNNIMSGRPGTWGALEDMRAVMQLRGWERPLLIGHAHHVGRVALQAMKFGMDPIVPAGLPRRFDHNSQQLWTKYLALWIPYEFIATRKLKHDGQL